MSELERFLAARLEAGQHQDSGKFTLDQEKALEKLGQFQLPVEHGWVLKVVQAAVCCGSSSLEIEQTRTETVFKFAAHQQALDGFERFYFQPNEAVNRAAEHLRRGLWAAGIGSRRPFQLSLPGGSLIHFWDGYSMESRPGAGTVDVCLSVSHRCAESGKGIPLLRDWQAAKTNASILQVVQRCCFPAPLLLYVDRRRISGFPRCPVHGFSPRSYPMQLMEFEPAGQEVLGLPPAEIEAIDQKLNQKLVPLTQGFGLPQAEARLGALGILSAHAAYDEQGEGGNWVTHEQASTLNWIADGVVVQTEEVALTRRCMSVGLYACADGVPTDLSGFGLQEETLTSLRGFYLQAAARRLETVELDFEIVDRRRHLGRQWMAGGAAGAGLLVKALIPPLGLTLLAGGLVATIILAGNVKYVLDKLEKDFARLVADWEHAFPPAIDP